MKACQAETKNGNKKQGKQTNRIGVKYDGDIKMLVHIKGMGYKPAHNLQKGSIDE